MNNHTDIILWQDVQDASIPTNCSDVSAVAQCAIQLSSRDRKQIIDAFNHGSYEMGTSFLWTRAMASLKRELGTLGVSFLAELLGKTDIDDDDNIIDVLSEKEAIKLASELGIVNPTDEIRLRHAQELVAYFSQRDSTENNDPMLVTDAQNILVSCVKNVLAKDRVQVAESFLDFRKKLETDLLKSDSQECVTLISQPYFFRRLAIVVLLSGIRQHSGVKLEICLRNFNIVLPILWQELKETERWQVGKTYAEVYSEGLISQTNGLKQALLKVHGFDYVPETLRSQTFMKAAEAIIRAHEGVNNFYTEHIPTLELEKLGTVIPRPAFGTCVTALLCVFLGNSYGTCWAAYPIAERILKQMTSEQWKYYFEKILPGETRILQKLCEQKPLTNWFSLFKIIGDLPSSGNKTIQSLIEASVNGKEGVVRDKANQLYTAYYGRNK